MFIIINTIVIIIVIAFDVVDIINRIKSKGLPRQAEVTQGVSGRLRPHIILTFRHYKGGRSSAKGTGRLYPRRNPWYSLSEAESTSGHMVLPGEPRKKSPVTSPGIDPGTIGLVAQRLNHYAIPGPLINRIRAKKMSKFVSIPGEDKFLPFSKTKRRDGPSQKLMLKQYWRGGSKDVWTESRELALLSCCVCHTERHDKMLR